MKKYILIILAILTLTMLSISTSDALVSVADGRFGEETLEVFSSSSWDGFYHAVFQFNNVSNTALATVLDPYGIPTIYPFGYIYFWADFYPTYAQLWGSNDGINWFFIGYF